MTTLLTCLIVCCAVLTASAQTTADDTVTTASGLQYIITKRGDGRTAQPGDYIVAHYTGMLTDGSVFDSSRERNEPFIFQLGKKQVIRGWDEAFSLLRIGDRARLIIPPFLGYGERGAGGGAIPPNATLIFDVELLDVQSETLGSRLSTIITTKGRAAAVAEYRKLKAQGFDSLLVSESELNALGYRFLQTNKTDDAIAVFELVVDLYPESFNAYDSLGEGYKTAGDTERAIANYERSLELNPDNENARRMLEVLRK